MNPQLSQEHLSMLLDIAKKKAYTCLATSVFYQSIPKKRHLADRWKVKGEKWQAVADSLETELLKY